MHKSDVQSADIDKEIDFKTIRLVFLKSKQKRGGEKNLLVFCASSGELLNNPSPPINSESQWDGFVGAWTHAGVLKVSSWSCFTYDIRLTDGQLINERFTK